MASNIQIFHVVNQRPRLDKKIFDRLSKYFEIDVHQINNDELKTIRDKKVHLIIFDGIKPKDILYSIIDKIQSNNRHLHTAVVMKVENSKAVTRAYDSHIDYVFDKSFDDNYQVAILKTILKRKSSKYLVDLKIEFKNIVVDLLLREIYVENKVVDTTNKEYKIIKELVKNVDAFTSKQDLFKYVWGYDEDSSRLLDQYLHRIKTKIGSKVELISDRKKGLRLI